MDISKLKDRAIADREFRIASLAEMALMFADRAQSLQQIIHPALAEGAVVTIEPGIYRPGWGGVRIEDDVFLGPDGPRILTKFTHELIELG